MKRSWGLDVGVELARRQGQRTRRILLRAMHRDRGLSLIGLARQIGRTQVTVRKLLGALTAEGLVEYQVGQNRKRWWRLTDAGAAHVR